MKIKEAELSDVNSYFDHLLRHFDESGHDGDLIFHPNPDYLCWDRVKFCEELKKNLMIPSTGLGWERLWLVTEGAKVVGHASLRGARMVTAAHRCNFSIGLERMARGNGLGRALTFACTSWARLQPNLDWIDLCVFATNKPARRLYERVGFDFIGNTKDQFRVGQTSIDDIHMCLQLKNQRAPSDN